MQMLICIATDSATAGINESFVADAAGPRQLKRAAAINGSVYKLIVQKCGNVRAKFCIPFRAGRSRVGLLLGGDGIGVERLVERSVGP